LTPTSQNEPQVNTIPDDNPVSKGDDPPQSSREETVKAKFYNIRERLQTFIQNSNGPSPIHLSFLDSSEIRNLSQMVWEIDLVISKFKKERDKQNESEKGKAAAKRWVHKFSLAGQRILGTANSATSVDSIFDVPNPRNSSPPQHAAWFPVPWDIS
jgi:hypothetical protein